MIAIDRHVKVLRLARPVDVADTHFEMAIAIVVINHQFLGTADIVECHFLGRCIISIRLTRVDALPNLLDAFVLARYWHELLRFS